MFTFCVFVSLGVAFPFRPHSGTLLRGLAVVKITLLTYAAFVQVSLIINTTPKPLSLLLMSYVLLYF